MEKFLMYVLVLFTFSNVGMANKTIAEVGRLDSNPTTSGTLSIGKILEDKDGQKYFTGLRGWTNYPVNHYVRPIMPRSQGDAKNYRYIGEICFLYAQEKTDNHGILNSDSYYKVMSVNSEKAKKLITKLADRQEFVGEINPSWQFCESDNECMRSKNMCGSLIGVNKKYEKHYLDFLKTNKLKLDCSKESTKTKTAESKCVENFCS